ncbi:MAG: PilZ domain-containing protein [Colwellia sp.]
MNGFDDKRDYYRMMLNSEVSVTILDSEANHHLHATCRDLSATGMAIEMDHPIELSTHLRVKIDSASEHVQSLCMEGKVVRVDEEEKSCYLIGIAIDEVC